MATQTAAVPFRRFALSGALAGALSAVSFALIHQLFINNIWFSAVIMMIVGAVCGFCLAGSYAFLITKPSVASWIRYNGLFVAMLVLLGLASVLVFDPVTTIAALLQSDGPPGELIGQALPMTAAFTLATAIVLSLVFRRGWRGFAVLLLTSTALVAFLGLNVSLIGLVAIPRSALYLVLELFGLIFALGFVYTALFIVFERKSLVTGTSA